jgi:hypothetical protein
MIHMPIVPNWMTSIRPKAKNIKPIVMLFMKGKSFIFGIISPKIFGSYQYQRTKSA